MSKGANSKDPKPCQKDLTGDIYVSIWSTGLSLNEIERVEFGKKMYEGFSLDRVSIEVDVCPEDVQYVTNWAYLIIKCPGFVIRN